jgi:DNA-binding transcriptional ArsR family regulator
MEDRKYRLGLETRARIMKALGHPTRLFIVETLESREHCVCELTAMIGADISTVSKHLSILKQAGVVRDQKRGSQVFYSLRVPCVLRLFDCVEAIVRDSAQDYLELSQ